ncbi:MAG: hydroxyneurosporene dehydrogenase [Phycisphaerae bacterium]|jgi:carotenoid 1,2-hydratase|nr:MAG: hydroxyneurosporene dehydrogenase [Phycisphaerae bacterium]
MDVVPLYLPNPVSPDYSHQVRIPGGYEWWYFDAEDPHTDTQLVAIFLHGFVFHPGYLRAHSRFMKNPTRYAPAIPDHFPCMYLCIYRNGRILHQFMNQYAPADYHAFSDQLDVRIGPNRLIGQSDGLILDLSGIPWELTWQGPKTFPSRCLQAQLSFTPNFSHPPVERIFLSRQMTGADHHWIIANPHCLVRGTLRLIEHNTEKEQIDFTGLGYHDHNFGTGPLGPGLKRWIWGRAILHNRVLTFHYAVPHNPSLPNEVHLIEGSEDGFRELQVRHTESDWIGWSKTGLRYPKKLAFHASNRPGTTLELTNPRLIDVSPFYMRISYDARIEGEPTSAFCEVAYPHRLRWPVLGRMIEMSISHSGVYPPRS